MQGLEKNKKELNNFGREFIGRKHVKGSIQLTSIESWLRSEELQNAYLDWVHINEEAEDHHSRGHKHKRPIYIKEKKIV